MKINHEINTQNGTHTFLVEFESDRLSLAAQEAMQKILKDFEIPGFRKGKVPLHVAQQHISPASVMDIYTTSLLQEALGKISTAHQTELSNCIGRPMVTVKKAIPHSSLECEITFSIRPEIILPEFKDIKINKEKVSITDTQVMDVIEEIRKLRAHEKLREANEGAEKGDRLTIDFEITSDGVIVEGGSGKKYSFISNEGKMIPAFEAALYGMKIGETKTFDLAYPEDYYEKKLAGKTARATVTLLESFARTLPEVSDEKWLGTLGSFTSFEDLKKVVRENLEQEAEMKAEQKYEKELLDLLTTKAKFGTIPHDLIMQEAQRAVQELAEDMKRRGIEFAQYLMHLKTDVQGLLEQMKPIAEKRIKAGLLLSAFADTQNIQISEKEAREEWERQHIQTHSHHSDHHNQDPTTEELHDISSRMRSRKAIEMIKEKVNK